MGKYITLWHLYNEELDDIKADWEGLPDSNHPAFQTKRKRKISFDLLPDAELEMLKEIQAEVHQENIQLFIRKFQVDYHIPSFLKPDGIDPAIVDTDIRLWGKIKESAKSGPKILKSGFTKGKQTEIREGILKNNRPKYGFDPRKTFPTPMQLLDKEWRKQKGEFKIKKVFP